MGIREEEWDKVGARGRKSDLVLSSQSSGVPDHLVPILHYLITIISANIIITIISANIIITIIIVIVVRFLQSSDVLDLLVPILH